MAKELSETRKPDRARMAKRLAEIVREAGGTVTIRDDATHVWPDGSRPLPECRDRLVLSITAPGGAVVGVDLDRRSCQPNIFVLCWNIAHDSDSRFNPGYWSSINQCHYAKATVIAHGFDHLCHVIRRDIESCVQGGAYSEEIKARMIAKEGTAAERNARFAKWLEEVAA